MTISKYIVSPESLSGYVNSTNYLNDGVNELESRQSKEDPCSDSDH